MSSNDFDDSIRNIDTPNNATNFTITDLIPQTNYTVYLSAFTGAGEGNISVSRTVSTLSIRKYFSNIYRIPSLIFEGLISVYDYIRCISGILHVGP